MISQQADGLRKAARRVFWEANKIDGVVATARIQALEDVEAVDDAIKNLILSISHPNDEISGKLERTLDGLNVDAQKAIVFGAALDTVMDLVGGLLRGDTGPSEETVRSIMLARASASSERRRKTKGAS